MILLRRSCLFFASEHDAYVGSLLVSQIATCQAARVNLVEYFVALRSPERWLPWNFATHGPTRRLSTLPHLKHAM